MSYFAMNHVRKLPRETGIVSTLKAVFMMIAWRVPPGRIETKPTSLGWLADSVGCDERTVRRSRDQLIRMKRVTVGKAGRGRGRFQTYIIPALAGPLFLMEADEGKADTGSGNDPQKTGQPVRLTGEKWTRGPVIAAGTRSSSVRTSRGTSTADAADVTTATAAVVYDRVLEFLTWYAEAYPKHHNGADITIDYEADGPRIKALLVGPPTRSVERLKSMSLVMWTATVHEDKFISEAPDRGIKFLVYVADRLDRISRAREAAAGGSADRQAQWATVCDLMRPRFDGEFGQWIAPLSFMTCRDFVTVAAPSREFRDALPNEIEERLAWAVKQVYGRRLQFMWPGRETEAAS